MKTTVIYHSADYDGIFCREIARKFLPDAELIGWNFGDEPVPLHGYPATQLFYVLDLPVDGVFGFSFKLSPRQPFFDPRKEQVIWIDHHKTSIETHPQDIPGYRIDGVAACRLAWQWFHVAEHNAQNQTNEALQIPLPYKQDFIDRNVSEPLSVRLAGEYDIWDKRDPRAETFQYALRVCEKKIEWDHLLQTENDVDVVAMLDRGEASQIYAQQTDASTCKHRTWVMEWEGLKFLCVNSARFNSLFFAAKDVPETGHDALLGFCFDGKCWTVSLYHAKHRTDLDLSEIAKRHGGGGHRGACGFTAKSLPFTL